MNGKSPSHTRNTDFIFVLSSIYCRNIFLLYIYIYIYYIYIYIYIYILKERNCKKKLQYWILHRERNCISLNPETTNGEEDGNFGEIVVPLIAAASICSDSKPSQSQSNLILSHYSNGCSVVNIDNHTLFCYHKIHLQQ